MGNKRIIVVGTTADYIENLDRRFPGRLTFITDTRERRKWSGPAPDKATEFLCDLDQPEEVLPGLQNHLDRFDLEPAGVACFDCESLMQAAEIARVLKLPFPSSEAIAASRNKYISKKIWRENGVGCPEARLIYKPGDAVEFLEDLGRPIILKPMSGSGSEFVFKCSNRIDCMRAFHAMQTGLAKHSNHRMYPTVDTAAEVNPREVFVAEEFLNGREYSCDIILKGDSFRIIRIARKIYAPDQPTGTTMAYVLPALMPAEVDLGLLTRQIHSATLSLGLKRCMAMVDFIVRQDRAYLLELTPRPGGDCLPSLMMAGSGFDILGAALDFAEGSQVDLPPPENWKRLVGLRLFATAEGNLLSVDMSQLKDDSRIVSVEMKRKPGDQIILPPTSYDSWLLGTVIFRPDSPDNIAEECQDITSRITVEMENLKWATRH